MKHTARNVKASGNRRSGLNRRWIKAPYSGPERRSGADRREERRHRRRTGRSRLFVPLGEKLEQIDCGEKPAHAAPDPQKDRPAVETETKSDAR